MENLGDNIQEMNKNQNMEDVIGIFQKKLKRILRKNRKAENKLLDIEKIKKELNGVMVDLLQTTNIQKNEMGKIESIREQMEIMKKIFKNKKIEEDLEKIDITTSHKELLYMIKEYIGNLYMVEEPKERKSIKDICHKAMKRLMSMDINTRHKGEINRLYDTRNRYAQENDGGKEKDEAFMSYGRYVVFQEKLKETMQRIFT